MFAIHPTPVATWKKQALAGLPGVFGNGREQLRQQADLEKDELDFLKKKSWLHRLKNAAHGSTRIIPI